MDLCDQVTIIWAGINGFLDSLPVTEVRAYEKELLAHAHAKYGDLMHTLATEKVLGDEFEAKIRAMVKEFSDAFLARRKAKG
jgi:F-type H+-transporting ATPase subunit alpha